MDVVGIIVPATVGITQQHSLLLFVLLAIVVNPHARHDAHENIGKRVKHATRSCMHLNKIK